MKRIPFVAAVFFNKYTSCYSYIGFIVQHTILATTRDLLKTLPRKQGLEPRVVKAMLAGYTVPSGRTWQTLGNVRNFCKDVDYPLARFGQKGWSVHAKTPKKHPLSIAFDLRWRSAGRSLSANSGRTLRLAGLRIPDLPYNWQRAYKTYCPT